MIAALDWVFASPARFTGFVILLVIVFSGVREIVVAARGR